MTKVPLVRDRGTLAAIQAAGGLGHLAKMINVKSPSISGWIQVPANRVLEIERKTNGRVTRYEMRPDLYPLDDPTDPIKRGFLPDLMGMKDKPSSLSAMINTLRSRKG